jgi:uncharacterized protein YoxC
MSGSSDIPDQGDERRVVTAQAFYELSMSTNQALTELKGEQALVRQSVDHVAETLSRMEATFEKANSDAAARLAEVKTDLKEDINEQDKRVTRLEDKVEGMSRKVWALAGGAVAVGSLISIVFTLVMKVSGGS